MNDEKKNITSFCFSGGWAAKLEPGRLNETVIKHGSTSDKLIVSFENSDDACVYQLTDELQLLSTVDVITPMVDDPYTFGQIAAANSLSDIFAMGGKVIYALNVCSFPKEMASSDADNIIKGALSKLQEINVPLAGGHTISEPSLLFGLSVNGIIDDNKYFSNDMAKPNQAVILTKPFGIGILYAANNNGLLSTKDHKTWIDTMTTLNYRSSQIAKKYISTMTDVTGFGLIGHAYEIAKASNISIEFDYNKIEFLPNAANYAKDGYITGASYTNYDYLKEFIVSEYDETTNLLLCDPQTSGGLLLFVDLDKKDELLSELHENNITAYCFGMTSEKKDNYIYLK